MRRTSFAQLSRDAKAGEQAKRVLELEAEFVVRRLERTATDQHAADLAHIMEGLRKAGLPE